MLEPWNDPSLLSPPMHTFKCAKFVDIKQLAYTCNNMIDILSKQSPLHMEAAICSRLVYKFDKKFRSDIGFRYFKKVNTALRKYLQVNILKDVENFHSLLPNSGSAYLPTRQMLEYVLIRLLTFSKIMVRVNVCSKQAAIFYFDRIKRGESHWMSLMPYALLSRIHSLSLVLLRHSCTWYDNLYKFVNELSLKGLDFLPAGYKLPSDLENWLELNNLENVGRFDWKQNKETYFDCPISDVEEDGMMDNILEFVNQLNNNMENEPHKTDSQSLSTKDTKSTNEKMEITEDNYLKTVDQGQKISRDMFKNFFKVPEQKIVHTPHMVTNKIMLKKFIANEEKFRNENNSQALTSHLSFMQWQALKTSLNSLYESLSKNRKIEEKFKRIWKEKCLDYE